MTIFRFGTQPGSIRARNPVSRPATRWISWFLAAALTLSSASAGGHEPEEPANPATESLDWVPPEPDPAEYDWIQLDTLEWLKGKIKRIQDDTVTFDSDKLDDLEFEWNDIVAMVTSKKHTFRFTGRRTVLGTCEMRGDVIRIRAADEVQEFERSELVSMVPGAGRERDYWSGKLSMGLSGQAGNTNQLSFNTSLWVARKTTFFETSLLYTGNMATQQNEISANAHRATTGANFYITRTLFLNVPRIEFQEDEFQNIDWRVTPSAGVGYDLILKKKFKWQVGTAVGFQAVKYGSVESGSDRSDDIPVLFLSRLDIALPKRFEWTNLYQLQLIATEIGNTNQHLNSTLSFHLWGPVDFDAGFQWDWVAEPRTDAAGNAPESSDFRISLGFALDL